MNLSPQWLDQLRGRLTLSALIGRSVKVEKAGREYKACCPFHSENTPSFTINDQKGFYHCFGCGAHGDAIRWMTDHRGLGFMDAVKELAGEAGMDVPAPDPQAAKRAEKRDSLYDVCAAAQDWFTAQLQGVAGAQAREYLEKRGIRRETQAKFGFGFAPDGHGNIAKALDGFPADKLVEAGLLISVDGKTPYDRFRGRLMIPIRDARGRTIAWGGRILGAKERLEREPKYLNSPDTPLFDKGRTLYNIDNAAAASRQTGRLIVVEGYMDAIALAQEGFEDVVAPLGTALTEEQITMAWKMADRPILCLDGDNAGQKAAARAVNRALPMLKPGKSLGFVRLTAGLDPDDFLRANGTAAMQGLINSADTIVEYLWHHERAKFSHKPDADERAALLAALKAHASLIEHNDLAREYRTDLVDRFFDQFGWNKNKLSKYADRLRSVANDNITFGRDKFIRAILLGLSRYPRVISDVIDDINELEIESGNLRDMLDILVEIAIGSPDAEQDMIEQIWEQKLGKDFKKRDYRSDLAFSFYHKTEHADRAENDLKAVFQILATESRCERQKRMANKRIDEEFSQDALDMRSQAESLQRQALHSLYERSNKIREYSEAA